MISFWYLVRTKESLESVEVEFILTVNNTCFFKNHHFYVESVAPIFKMEVLSQVPINKDNLVLSFFRLRTSKRCLKVLSRNCIRLLIVNLVFFNLGFWIGNLFLIALFPDLCLLVHCT